MIVVLKQNSDKEHVDRLMQHFMDMGLKINYSEGDNTTILGLMGDTTKLDERDIMAYEMCIRDSTRALCSRMYPPIAGKFSRPLYTTSKITQRRRRRLSLIHI